MVKLKIIIQILIMKLKAEIFDKMIKTKRLFFLLTIKL